MRVEVSSRFTLSTGSSRVIRLSRNLYRLPTCNDLAFGPANWCKGYLQCKLEVHTKHNDTTHELLLITRGEFHRDSLFFTTSYTLLYEHWIITNNYFEQKQAVAAAPACIIVPASVLRQLRAPFAESRTYMEARRSVHVAYTRRRSLVDAFLRSVKCDCALRSSLTSIYTACADFGERRKEQRNQRACGAGVTWCSDLVQRR